MERVAYPLDLASVPLPGAVVVPVFGLSEGASISQYVMEVPNLWIHERSRDAEWRTVLPQNPLRNLQNRAGTIAGVWGEAVLQTVCPVLASTGEQCNMLGNSLMTPLTETVIDTRKAGSSSTSTVSAKRE